MGSLPVPGTATQPLTCVECGRMWLLAFEVWRMYLTDDEPSDAVIYAPTVPIASLIPDSTGRKPLSCTRASLPQ
jgi:hypothetical protein